MAIMDQMNISNLLQQQAMDTLMKQQGQGGLLGQPQSRLQAGLLGAAQGLAPYMGYSTTPTTFGQAAVAGLTGAASGVQQQQQQQLQDALTQLQLASELKPDEVKGESSIGKLYSDYNKGLIPESVFQEAVKSETGKEYAPTSLQKNVPFLMEIYGITEKEAADRLIDSPEKTIQDLKKKLYTSEAFLQNFISKDRIEEVIGDMEKEFGITTSKSTDFNLSKYKLTNTEFDSVEELFNLSKESNKEMSDEDILKNLQDKGLISNQ